MVARRPDDLGEAFCQQAERPFNVLDPLADVTRDNQPVLIGPGPEPLDEVSILCVDDMQVAYREQISCLHDVVGSRTI